MGMFSKELGAQSVKHKKNQERYFFFHIVLHKQENSCLKIRKGTQKPHEVSYRYCSSIQYFKDSNNLHHEGKCNQQFLISRET